MIMIRRHAVEPRSPTESSGERVLDLGRGVWPILLDGWVKVWWMSRVQRGSPAARRLGPRAAQDHDRDRAQTSKPEGLAVIPRRWASSERWRGWPATDDWPATMNAPSPQKPSSAGQPSPL